jgi:hypothetical protein
MKVEHEAHCTTASNLTFVNGSIYNTYEATELLNITG